MTCAIALAMVFGAGPATATPSAAAKPSATVSAERAAGLTAAGDWCTQLRGGTWTQFKLDGDRNMVINAAGYGGSGARVIMWPNVNTSNEWWCEEDASEGGFYIHPGYNRWLCMDDPGGNEAAGTKLVIWNCNGGANQRFEDEDAGYGTCWLFTADLNRAVDAHDQQNFRVQLWYENSSAAQTWRYWSPSGICAGP